MADNFLENHYEEYERKKTEWLRRKKRLPKITKQLERPEYEALSLFFSNAYNYYINIIQNSLHNFFLLKKVTEHRFF